MEKRTVQRHQVKLLTILHYARFVLLRLQLALFSYNKEISFFFLNKHLMISSTESLVVITRYKSHPCGSTTYFTVSKLLFTDFVFVV